jgi:hypothetical protein
LHPFDWVVLIKNMLPLLHAEKISGNPRDVAYDTDLNTDLNTGLNTGLQDLATTAYTLGTPRQT